MRREYRLVATDEVVGELVIRGDEVRFSGGAAGVLRGLRRRMGDRAVAGRVMADGWSNGYVYFSEPEP